MLNAEMDVHLAKETEAGIANHRNGTSDKAVLTPEGDCFMAGAQADRTGAASHLPGGQRHGCRRSARILRSGRVGAKISRHCPKLAGWEAITPFFAFSAEVRRIIYTTNAIESLNASVRKAVRNKGHFPNDQAATKLIWLALRNIEENWKNPPISWHAAKAQLAIQFEDRFVSSE